MLTIHTACNLEIRYSKEWVAPPKKGVVWSCKPGVILFIQSGREEKKVSPESVSPVWGELCTIKGYTEVFDFGAH